MAFTHLSDLELHDSTLKAASNEKAATLALLEHILETDIRRSYLKRGHESIWTYVRDALGYSPQQTSERVSAMKLMKRHPDLGGHLESGHLSLTSAAQIERFIRTEKKSDEEARAVFEECIGKSSREVERILLPDETTPRPDFVKAVSKEKTRITIEVDQEFMELLTRAKELGRDPSVKPQEVFERALREFVKKREVKEEKKNHEGRESKETIERKACEKTKAPKPENPRDPVRAPEITPHSDLPLVPPQHQIPKTRAIPAETKTALRRKAQDRCQFVDRVSGKRCDCRTGLEIHHCHPFAHGGSHALENLSLLCRAHHAAIG